MMNLRKKNGFWATSYEGKMKQDTLTCFESQSNIYLYSMSMIISRLFRSS